MTASAFYEGHIRHRRFAVRKHEFRYDVAMAYLDLDELPSLLGGRLTRSTPGLVRFRRDDTWEIRRRRWTRRSRTCCCGAAAASAADASRIVALRFRVRHPLSPLAASYDGDPRPLGIALRGLSLG